MTQDQIRIACHNPRSFSYVWGQVLKLPFGAIKWEAVRAVQAHAVAQTSLELALIKKQFQSPSQPINCGILIACIFLE